jgi:putative heme-binding domain-containing protein
METLAQELPMLIDLLIKRAKVETDPACLLQIASSLGAWGAHPKVAPTLDWLIVQHGADPFIEAAALSSMPQAETEISLIDWQFEPRPPSHPLRAALVTAALEQLPKEGNSERGKTVYNSQCLICHAVKDGRNAIGPDLTALSNRSPEFLIESILDPQQAIDPDYMTHTLTLRSGKNLTGILKEVTASTFQLASADGTTHKILRKDVTTGKNLNRSLMPETFDKTISDPQQLRDLIAYLQKLK